MKNFSKKLTIVSVLSLHKIFSFIFYIFVLINATSAFSATDSNNLLASDQLNSCNPAIAIAAAERIVNSPDTLAEPTKLLYPAYVIFMNGDKNRGVFLFNAARFRLNQQKLVNNNNGQGQDGLVQAAFIGFDFDNYSYLDTDNFNKILDQVLDWDGKTPKPFFDGKKSEEINEAVRKATLSFNEFRKKIIVEKANYENTARKQYLTLKNMEEVTKRSKCPNNYPTYIQPKNIEEIKSRWLQVKNFIIENETLKLDAGDFKIITALKGYNEVNGLFSKYLVWISDAKINDTYAVINVDSASKNNAITLDCIIHTKKIIMGKIPTQEELCK